jgi:transcriptional regulator with XRE-family HTH domain
MDLREVFASNLRRIRNAKGVSQDELALEASVSRGYLSQLEKGVFYVSLNVLGRLAVALEVEPAEFLQLPGSKSSKRR